MFKYTTKVRIDREILKGLVPQLKADYESVGNRETKQGRSLFSRYNNIAKFEERLDTDLLDVVGEAKGGTTRVYYKPSVTSLAKPFRKCIVPVYKGNKFLYFDLKAAEFALFCIFAQEAEAVQAYQRGEDIYMQYASLFPEGCQRPIIKKILIANMYGQTPYSVAIDLGISENHAGRLLDEINRKLPRMAMMKRNIIAQAMRANAYYCPTCFDQTHLNKVAEVNPATGFSPNYALSVYIQSSLGLIMQAAIKKLELRFSSKTLLTVFDSMLLEVSENQADEVFEWCKTQFAPLIPGTPKLGDTFWDAVYE